MDGVDNFSGAEYYLASDVSTLLDNIGKSR
jgi:hypothetical protein